jgi:quercetin dioxygenase-like cupin family protein
MQSTDSRTTILHRIVEETHNTILGLPGPAMEFLSPPDGRDDFCVIKGVIPPGVVVPLHSHVDTETFFVVSGTTDVLTQSENGLGWTEVHAGDYVHIASDTPHAWRNSSGEPVTALIITTRRLGRYFQELGKPINGAPEPPTPDDLERFIAVSAKFGYWNGTPEENAAVGIELPAPAALNR